MGITNNNRVMGRKHQWLLNKLDQTIRCVKSLKKRSGQKSYLSARWPNYSMSCESTRSNWRYKMKSYAGRTPRRRVITISTTMRRWSTSLSSNRGMDQ